MICDMIWYHTISIRISERDRDSWSSAEHLLCGTQVIYIILVSSYNVERTHHQLPCKLDPGSQRLLTLSRPWNVFSAHRSHSGSHLQGHSLERVRCHWDHLGGICEWTQSRPLYELLRFWLPETRLVSEFPCLLELPPTDLEQSAFFFLLPLPFVYRGQFQISAGKLQSVKTNISPRVLTLLCPLRPFFYSSMISHLFVLYVLWRPYPGLERCEGIGKI